MAERRPGSRHWLAQRLTACALAPLSFWFAFALATEAGGGRAAIAAWIGEPITALALFGLLVIGLWHALQGIEVVLVDYVHSPGQRRGTLLVSRVIGVALGALGAFSIASLAIGAE